MTPKLLEIRDRRTFVPVLAISIDEFDGYLARRAGFGSRCIQLVVFASSRTEYDPYSWESRTLSVAHNYISDNWETISDHDVIDVEFLLGETTSPKLSERVTS